MVVELDRPQQTLRVPMRNCLIETRPVADNEPVANMLWLRKEVDLFREKLFTGQNVLELNVVGVKTNFEPMYDMPLATPVRYLSGPNPQVVLEMSTIENPPSQQKNDAQWTWADPQIRCPNCGSIVNGLTSGTEAVPIGKPQDTAIGLPKPKFNQKPVDNPGQYQAGMAQRMVYRVSACGCQVSQEWASAYAEEVSNRKAGKKGKEVSPLSPQEIESQKAKLNASIKNLYNLKHKWEQQDSMLAMGELAEIERQLVLKVDALMKLCPGDHNKLPPTQLSQATLAWAAKNGRAIPPSKANIVPSQAEILQTLASGGMISASAAAELMGINFADEQKAMEKEAQFQAEQQAQLQEEMQQVNPPAQETKIPGKAPGYSQSQVVNPSQIAASGGVKQGVSPQALAQQANQIATGLLTCDAQKRESELALLKKSNPQLHAMVKLKLATKTNAAQAQHPNPNTGLQTLPDGPKPTAYGKLPGAGVALGASGVKVSGNFIPKQNIEPGAIVEDAEGNPIGVAAGKPDASGKVEVYPFAPGQPVGPTGPVVPPVTGQAPNQSEALKKAQDQAIAAQAKKIQAELLAHQATGAPLSPETQQFLKTYQEATGANHNEVPGPSARVPGNANGKLKPEQCGEPPETQEQFLDRVSTRNRRKISAKKRRST